MYCVDGPLDYRPDFSNGVENMTEEDLYKSPTGMPSINVGGDSFVADRVIEDLKRIHKTVSGQFTEFSPPAGNVNGAFANVHMDILCVSKEPVVKSSVAAIKLRICGNEEFKKDRLEEALQLYTRSIANALEGSIEQMLAFGNRSATLLRLGEWESCLHDINRASESDVYPRSSRDKLEQRKEACLTAIREISGYGEIDINATDPVNVRENDDDAEWRSLCRFNNRFIPNASAKVKIMCDAKWGRYLVATEDIEAGEILSCQKFNALLLRKEKEEELAYCSFCLSKCLALIPCPTCTTTEALYCSKYCRARAYESYHRLECKLIHKACDRSYKLRAMRMFIEGTGQGVRLPDLMAQMKAREVMAEKTDPSNKPFKNDYVAVLRMCRTFNSSFATSFYSFVTDFINGLRDIGHFGHNSRMNAELSEAEIFTAMLLLNHATSARSHSFAISPAHDFNCVREETVGIGICALHSLVNNSCDPNVSFFTRNREHVLIATRPIRKGEQLFHAYLETFQRGTSLYRKYMFSMFFGFKCKCIACIKGWPMTSKLQNRGIKFIDGSKNKAKREFLQVLMPLTEGRILELSNGEIITNMSRICKWLYTHLKKPSFEFLQCEVGLIQFMILTYDNLSKKFTREQTREYIESLLKSIETVVLLS